MSKTVKIILALVCGSILICGIGATVVGVFGYRFTQDIATQAPKTRKQAEAFASTVDQTKCLPEVIKRHQGAAGSVSKQTQLSIFFTTCISKATPVPTFCDDVPGQSGEIMKTIAANKTFATKRCASYKGLKNPVCLQYVQIIPTVCHQKRTKKKMVKPALKATPKEASKKESK